jgi:hypothetical protein
MKRSEEIELLGQPVDDVGEFGCLECGFVSAYRKRLAMHVKSKHGLEWRTYLAKHWQSEDKE